MTLARDLSHLPADHRTWAPDEHPRFAPLLAEAWRDANEAEFERSKAFDTKMRVSKVGQCARSTAYEIIGAERTEPLTLADHWRMGLGTTIHNIIEPVLAKAFPGASIEFPVDLRNDEMTPVDMSGSGDVALVDHDGRRIVIEVKTINGFGGKMLVGARGKGEGPKSAHLIQGAILAHAMDADELVILYLFLELLSPRERDKLGTDEIGRFTAEFTIPREQYEALAQSELRRLQRIIDIIDEGGLPPRSIPEVAQKWAKAVIVDPMKGRWEARSPNGDAVLDSGETWNCAYCSFRSRCIEDGAT